MLGILLLLAFLLEFRLKTPAHKGAARTLEPFAKMVDISPREISGEITLPRSRVLCVPDVGRDGGQQATRHRRWVLRQSTLLLNPGLESGHHDIFNSSSRQP